MLFPLQCFCPFLILRVEWVSTHLWVKVLWLSGADSKRIIFSAACFKLCKSQTEFEFICCLLLQYDASVDVDVYKSLPWWHTNMAKHSLFSCFLRYAGGLDFLHWGWVIREKRCLLISSRKHHILENSSMLICFIKDTYSSDAGTAETAGSILGNNSHCSSVAVRWLSRETLILDPLIPFRPYHE